MLNSAGGKCACTARVPLRFFCFEERNMIGCFQDLTGQRFGRLIVVKRAENTKSGDARWMCKCDCGNETIVKAKNLKSGGTKSCGCLQKEIARETCKVHSATHRMSKTTIYNDWNSMKQRCYNPNSEKYHRYGERGIIVCDRWRDSFEAFYEDVSKLPHFGEQGYTLNRIDNDGNYEPNNVEWATPKEQANNRQSNHLLTFNDKTQTIVQWAYETGIKSATIARRLKKGWSVEKALTTPTRKRKVG